MCLTQMRECTSIVAWVTPVLIRQEDPLCTHSRPRHADVTLRYAFCYDVCPMARKCQFLQLWLSPSILSGNLFFLYFSFLFIYFFCASFYVICNLPIDYLFPLPFTQSKARRSLLLSLHAIQLCLACEWHSSLHSLNPVTSLYLRDWRELCPDSSSAFTVSLQMVRKLYSIHSTEPHTRFSKLMYSRPHTKDYCVGRYTEICIISDRSRPFSWLCLIFPVDKGSPIGW